MTIPPREAYDPDSNDPNQRPLEVIVRCARCAESFGEQRARQFGRLVYAAGNRTHGVRSAETGERPQGWAWFPLTERRTPNSFAGATKTYRRAVRVDRAGAPGVQLHCPACKAAGRKGWAPRLGMARLQELATEAATRGQPSIFV